ncbi:carbon storage regulator CsrA [Sediminibacillus massiliensis]|uniref:carbon storage regulator CsrA n=1 Tax=Sediminibacillus massiliensis TaxID=1926277 RepID=UPI0009884184|nr:carbon storage regulator CsrA [Sediminibacillus massiliensis]
MLVLTRKINEAIKIGEDIEIKILSIDGEQIKLGIEAPKHVDIYRKEIYVDIQQENQGAAQGSADLLNILKNNIKKD